MQRCLQIVYLSGSAYDYDELGSVVVLNTEPLWAFFMPGLGQGS